MRNLITYQWGMMGHRSLLEMLFCSTLYKMYIVGTEKIMKLLNKGFLVVKLKSSLWKFCGCHPWLTVTVYLFHICLSICTVCHSHNAVLIYFYTSRNEVVGGILVSPCLSVCRQILCRTITWVVFLRIF